MDDGWVPVATTVAAVTAGEAVRGVQSQGPEVFKRNQRIAPLGL
jgi:hypothetical protein